MCKEEVKRCNKGVISVYQERNEGVSECHKGVTMSVTRVLEVSIRDTVTVWIRVRVRV